MSDPRVQSLLDRKQDMSPLMKAQALAKGEKVNFCPFGCSLEVLDEHGYCRHLIGFTNEFTTSAQNKVSVLPGAGYEPMVRRLGKRIVQIPGRKVMSKTVDPEDKEPEWEWVPDPLPKISPDDILERITTSCRVYRDVDKFPLELPKQLEKAKAK